MLPELIDKKDNYEIVLEQIVQILKDETASQQALAVAAGKDPGQWAFGVYSEPDRPWLMTHNADGTIAGKAPIVAVYYNETQFSKEYASNLSAQDADTRYQIICIGAKSASEQGPGDELAASETRRIVRLVRNIIQAEYYSRLQLPGTVKSRFTTAIRSVSPPDEEIEITPNVRMLMIELQVELFEDAPLLVTEDIEKITLASTDFESEYTP